MLLPMLRSLVLPLVLLTAACGPEPLELAQQVTAGELDQVLPVLAALPEEHELAEHAALAREWQSLAVEREAVRSQEADMLLEAARARIDSDDPGGAVASISAGLRGHPEVPAFAELAKELAGKAQAAPPDQSARIYLALAEIHAADTETSATYRVQARQQALRARYAADRLDSPLSGQVGISAEAARGVLARVDLEYPVVPDWAAMEAAGRQQLVWLANSPEGRAAWPSLSEWPGPDVPDQGPDSLQGANSALETLVRKLGEHGLPEELVRDEWMTGALAALDPWTRAVWPAEIASWSAHHSGITVGVGLSFLDVEGEIYVDRPELDSPAWTSKIHQGDRVVALEDARGTVRLEELPAERRLLVTEAMMSGDPGSPIALQLVDRDGETYVETLVRAGVAMETLRGVKRGTDNAWDLWLHEGDGLAYVRVLAFRDYTEPDFDALLEPVLDEVRGMVLDLRGNPGGDVDAAVQIADRFVANGWLVDISGRVLPDTGPDVDPETGETLAAWNAALEGHALEGVPLVVLVDEDSASASEVLAGCLQEKVGAVVVGMPTWGKGYAQALRTDPEGRFALQLTNLVWTLPSGRRLAREVEGGGGILPSVPLALSPGEDFQADLLSRQRAALRSHADGVPLEWTDTVAREDLSPLSEDPGLVLGELVLRSVITQQQAAASELTPPG